MRYMSECRDWEIGDRGDAQGTGAPDRQRYGGTDVDRSADQSMSLTELRIALGITDAELKEALWILSFPGDKRIAYPSKEQAASSRVPANPPGLRPKGRGRPLEAAVEHACYLIGHPWALGLTQLGHQHPASPSNRPISRRSHPWLGACCPLRVTVPQKGWWVVGADGLWWLGVFLSLIVVAAIIWIFSD
jgi:hypothetical protein